MRVLKFLPIIFTAILMTSCASGYKTIQPESINYVSTNEVEGVKVAYKYNVLQKKYAKKELKRGVKLVAVKITNDSESDLVFGKDLVLTHNNGDEVYLMENETIFKSLKQGTAGYLFYLLLTPANFSTTETTNGVTTETSSFPIGLILGPALAGGNMLAAGSANKNFREELESNNLNGVLIKKGESKVGLVGFRTKSFDALTVKLK